MGLGWGLPSRDIDRFLFPSGNAWSGERILSLVRADEKFGPALGADVDPDPLAKTPGALIRLNATDADVAKILLRYRLFTHQPDEMITMMSLAGMKPGELNLDPKLYQYGGLFIYPVGAMLKACDIAGLIDVRSDLAFYLDHPEEFGKFYLVSRGYAAAWGLVGVFVVFAIGRRLGGDEAGLAAALLIALLPVTISMSHEGKPHLPGAVLMLTAVLLAMKHVARAASFSPRGGPERDEATKRRSHEGEEAQSQPDHSDVELGNAANSAKHFWLMCGACGAAQGMVLSSLPIFVLIPLVVGLDLLRDRSEHGASVASAAGRIVMGTLLALSVYLLTNPYVAINLVANREVLASNFGNSLAMYEVDRIAEGLLRTAELTVEGTGAFVAIVGIVALFVAIARKRRDALPLIVPAAVLFLQFVAIGAGKPAEYGRFGIFVNAALAIGTGVLLTNALRTRWRHGLGVIAAAWTLWCGSAYLRSMMADAANTGTRRTAAAVLEDSLKNPRRVILNAEPAPYGCPPLDFERIPVFLRVPDGTEVSCEHLEPGDVFVRAVDTPAEPHADAECTLRVIGGPAKSPISWANKPFEILSRTRADR